MRFSIVLPDEAGPAVRDRAAEVSADQARGPLARLEAELQTAAPDRDRLTERVRVLEDERRAIDRDLFRLEARTTQAESDRDHLADTLAEIRHSRDQAEGLLAAAVTEKAALIERLPRMIAETAGPSAGTSRPPPRSAGPGGSSGGGARTSGTRFPAAQFRSRR